MKNIIIDLDGTITIDNKNKEYFEKDVNLKVVKKLKRAFEIRKNLNLKSQIKKKIQPFPLN